MAEGDRRKRRRRRILFLLAILLAALWMNRDRLFAPGLEFIWPASVALVAGLVGAAVMSRFVLPALADAQSDAALARGGQVNA